MNARAGLALALIGASGALLFAARNSLAAPSDDTAWWPAEEGDAPIDAPAPDPFEWFTESIGPTMNDSQREINVRAFLMMIRTAEGTAGPDGYRTLFGGSLFDSFADHPRIAKRFTDKAGRTLWTTAAGAYQALAVSPIPTGGSTKVNTWDRIKARLALPDFSPASQDAMAVELIREAGALDDVQAGRFDSAVRRVRGVWASLPGAGYQQSERSTDYVRQAYVSAGGQLA